jgi:WD40 repeat protein
LPLAPPIVHFECKFKSINSDVDAITDICRWNPERQNVRYSTELRGHSAGIERVAFNPVKDAELCSVSSDGVVKFWDVRTKAVINEIKGLGDAFTLAWCPDGESLVVGNKVCLPFTA